MKNSKSASKVKFKNIISQLPKLDKATDENVALFIESYYAFISNEDLETYSDEHLAHSALSHYRLGLHRRKGQDIVRAFNPTEKKDGWLSKHTIVEIITDNRPFLIDSVTMYLSQENHAINLTIHPILVVERDASNNISHVSNAESSSTELYQESFIRFEINKKSSSTSLKEIEIGIKKTLKYIDVVTKDWKALQKSTEDIKIYLQSSNLPFTTAEIEESIEFCHWLTNNNFTFLGACEFDFSKGRAKYIKSSGLGILRDAHQRRYQSHEDLLPVASSSYVPEKELITITKANGRSIIHRPAYMDFVAINRYNNQGKLIGQFCIIGLFTASAYHQKALQIPLLRHKLESVLEKSKLPPQNHKYNKLINVFDTYPRDSLLAISEKDLLNNSLGILALQERQKTKLFVRHDKYDRFYSCLVYVPKDKYNRDVRIKIQDTLMASFNGISNEFTTHFSESVLARVHFVIRKNPGTKTTKSIDDTEKLIQQATHTWDDYLSESLHQYFGEELGNDYLENYKNAFSVGYRNDFSDENPAKDIEILESLTEEKNITVKAYNLEESKDNNFRMKLFSYNRAIAPSDSLPVVENMGLKVLSEKPYSVKTSTEKELWVHDFNLIVKSHQSIDLSVIKEYFEQAFLAIWKGLAENDRFNQLIIDSQLTWKQVAVLRAYSKYLRQIGILYSEEYMTNCLLEHVSITQNIIKFFIAKFDPTVVQSTRDKNSKEYFDELNNQLNGVNNIDDDRILKSYINLIDSTIRTNFFQLTSDGNDKSYISFKFNPHKIDNMPQPKPMFEIFVCSPRVEAVHLRGGKVARGGLRWSDRREDFRTEVLGLVKAQLVKNAVIVPTGSKGGFFVKQPPSSDDRNDIVKEGIECYKIFINGMLDITDNLVKSKVVPPEDVVRYDEDDPYLVVAADKGTATFSDIANGVADERGFWLSDAFASGGSVGYDHKGMGITARGAWESVKRHFRELGINTQAQDFSVVGIGDMAGDVFGNGMLLSEHIKLVGAFNHLHIFVDPEPDVKASFKERKRLFGLSRSSWQDYEAKLISKGGGIFERSMKSIDISAEMQKAFEIEEKSLTPTQLINAMLKAPVDLVWNGGIGTYVKSSAETHQQASDKANDNLRVNGNELRCKVVGEGGNLGMTQLGRIEYCQHGGKCYTDFIDNSAGVDTSDHEVNIKILLNDVSEQGKSSYAQRNKLLASMTDEVAELVLNDNYQQTQALSIELSSAHKKATEYVRFINKLEKHNVLNRKLEFLPSDEDIHDRAKQGQSLTAPELCVLLAYTKIDTYNQLLESNVPDDAFIRNVVGKYFPSELVKKYRTEISNHQLRREIVATYIANKIINQLGPLSIFHLNEMTGASVAEIVRAYVCACEIFQTDKSWQNIESLDNKAPAQIQIKLLDDTAGLIDRCTLWLLRNRRFPINIEKTVDIFAKDVANLRKSLSKHLAKPNLELQEQRKKMFMESKVPASLAGEIASFVALSSALDIVEVANDQKIVVDKATKFYFELGDQLRLHWLRDQIAKLNVENQWHLLAKSSLRNNLHRLQRLLTSDVIKASKSKKTYSVTNWLEENEAESYRFNEVVDSLHDSSKIDFPMLSVALGELQILRQGS